MLDFPANPAIGQAFSNYTWDGEKWTSTAGAAGTGAVRYDVAQTLTPPQQVQARSNIYAAPLDALSYSGIQFNGSMEVSQANGINGVSVPNASAHILDGWKLINNGVAVLT
jgi:hypothetical protein